MRSEFITALTSNQNAFGIGLTAEQTERLADFYDLVQEHNPMLHLVGPCTAEEFAVRHVLESLSLLRFLPQNTRFADVGPGAGFPSVPCLIVRESLSAVWIEAKEKKSSFLREVRDRLGIGERAEIVNRQFSEVKCPEDVTHVACRALDKFTQKLPQLLKWSGDRKLLFFGGPTLGAELASRELKFTEHLMPMSEQRFLYVIA